MAIKPSGPPAGGAIQPASDSGTTAMPQSPRMPGNGGLTPGGNIGISPQAGPAVDASAKPMPTPMPPQPITKDLRSPPKPMPPTQAPPTKLGGQPVAQPPIPTTGTEAAASLTPQSTNADYMKARGAKPVDSTGVSTPAVMPGRKPPIRPNAAPPVPLARPKRPGSNVRGAAPAPPVAGPSTSASRAQGFLARNYKPPGGAGVLPAPGAQLADAYLSHPKHPPVQPNSVATNPVAGQAAADFKSNLSAAQANAVKGDTIMPTRAPPTLGTPQPGFKPGAGAPQPTPPAPVDNSGRAGARGGAFNNGGRGAARSMTP